MILESYVSQNLKIYTYREHYFYNVLLYLLLSVFVGTFICLVAVFVIWFVFEFVCLCRSMVISMEVCLVVV